MRLYATERDRAAEQPSGDRVGKVSEITFQRELKDELTERYGPMVSGNDLRLVLGYPSQAAFRQALTRGTLPIPVFSVEHRRGKFAFVQDVAAWLAKQRKCLAASDEEEKQ